MNIRTWLRGVANYWWTELPGYQYTRQYQGRWYGTGFIARESPGAYNLYALAENLPLPADGGFIVHQIETLPQLVGIQQWCKQEIAGYPIEEWAIFLKPKEFMQWMDENKSTLKKLPTPHGYPTLMCFYNKLQKALATHH